MKPARMVSEPEGLSSAVMEPASVSAAAPVAQLGLVIPTLQEAANIRTVLDRVRWSLDPLGIAYELIVVDDLSGDGIDAIVREIAAADVRVRFVSRIGKRGLGSAVRHGWQSSNAEFLGVIDADLQHPPELLPELWNAVHAGSDGPRLPAAMFPGARSGNGTVDGICSLGSPFR